MSLQYDLGKVVGENGQDGDDGNGIVSIEKTGTSGLVDTYTITYTDGDTDTFTVTNGSDASVTIVSSWSATTSDSKVPSEKLAKTSLDGKVDKVTGKGLSTNDFTNGYKSTIDGLSTVATSGSYSDLSNKPSIPSSSGDLSDGSDLIKKSSTTGLIKNNGTIDTNSYLTTSSASSTYQTKLVSGTSIKTINNESLLGSGNISVGGGSSVDIVTAWESTPSDTKVPSEKLTKQSIDTKVGIDVESGNAFFEDDSNNGHIYLFDSHLDYNVNNNEIKYDGYELATLNDIPSLANYIQKSSTVGLVKNNGTIDTNTYLTSSAITGMLTTSDVVDNLTSTSSTAPLSAKQGKALNDLIGQAITYINQ